MKDSKDIADWILKEISRINPYTSADKNMAFIWATGFLARVCAEMIWRDNHNLEIFRRIREKNTPKR
jgi:hypothetical protein